jgi:hypothetical protein
MSAPAMVAGRVSHFSRDCSLQGHSNAATPHPARCWRRVAGDIGFGFPADAALTIAILAIQLLSLGVFIVLDLLLFYINFECV